MGRDWRSRCGVVRAAVAGTAALVAMAACTNREPYRLGVVLSSDGMHGARLAASSINAAGGVRGRHLELRDLGGASSGSAQIALTVAESLAADPRVLGVVGHANSSASLAASQVYNARHVVQIAPTTTTPLFSQAGPWSFRLVGSDEYQARFLAGVIASARPVRTAIVYVNDDYGRALRRMVRAELESLHVQPVRDVPYVESGPGDPAELVRTLAGNAPSLLLWLGRPAYFARLAAPLRAALPTVDIVASDGFGGAMVEADSGGLYSGIRHVRLVDIERPDSVLQRVRARYRFETSQDLSDEAALAYDAVMVLAQAIAEAGPDRGAIREWMTQLGREHAAVNGITGPIAFATSGDRPPRYVLDTVRQPSAPAAR